METAVQASGSHSLEAVQLVWPAAMDHADIGSHNHIASTTTHPTCSRIFYNQDQEFWEQESIVRSTLSKKKHACKPLLGLRSSFSPFLKKKSNPKGKVSKQGFHYDTFKIPKAVLEKRVMHE